MRMLASFCRRPSRCFSSLSFVRSCVRAVGVSIKAARERADGGAGGGTRGGRAGRGIREQGREGGMKRGENKRRRETEDGLLIMGS